MENMVSDSVPIINVVDRPPIVDAPPHCSQLGHWKSSWQCWANTALAQELQTSSSATQHAVNALMSRILYDVCWSVLSCMEVMYLINLFQTIELWHYSVLVLPPPHPRDHLERLNFIEISSHLVIFPPFFAAQTSKTALVCPCISIRWKMATYQHIFLWELWKKRMLAILIFTTRIFETWKRGMKAISMGAVHWEEAANDPAVWTDIRADSGRTRKSSRAICWVWEEVNILTAVPTMIATMMAWIVLLKTLFNIVEERLKKLLKFDVSAV